MYPVDMTDTDMGVVAQYLLQKKRTYAGIYCFLDRFLCSIFCPYIHLMHATLESSTTQHSNLKATKHFVRPELLQQATKSLVITAQPAIYANLCKILEAKGFEVDWQIGKISNLAELPVYTYDLVLLGPTADNENDPQLWTELRRRTLSPIILLTDAYHVDQHVQAFELGVDRVITLPFEAQTLTAHITALLRRTSWARRLTQTEALSVGAIYLCHDTHTVKVSDRPIELSPLDYRLLHYLMQRVNCAVSKAELRRALWDDQTDHRGNFIEVAIRRLRNKIEENPSSPKYLVTQYGIGYKLIHS